MAASLKSVDQLTMTFLVDNCIEWFTKLPPGFSLEIKTHLQENHMRVDKLTDTPILDFDKFCCGAHGFAALIETEMEGEPRQYTLFDTGPDNTSLVRNIRAMQTPVEKITRVVHSHWHSDHTGGLLSFLDFRQNHPSSADAAPCIIDVHPDRPVARGMASGPTYTKVIARLKEDPSFESIEKFGAKVEKNAEGHSVANGTVWVSGEVPRVTDFESEGLKGHMRWKDGQWVSEPHIMDERYAAIDVVGKGLVIVSACSHAGIINVVKSAVDKFHRPIYMIIGGLHLAGNDMFPRVQPTAEFLSRTLRPSPTYVLPMHCSGFQAKLALEKELGDGCVPAGVGIKFDVTGDRGHDARLSAASYK
ncbi:hypothetical protein E1B28_000561 [Marasmius oreades]|uniref:Metallo-beta-lactamase domain-containing protein n=1 Tax=Marasmius oreades TaxID=181124 RepID=A0A9P7V1R1_9AGAR|nr:uncharacterized protein E1B28_000561 [Marasmius oreades]KAG7098645.1 hypothetical protein E1B28_000561 [Marasmius oreades]